MNSNIYHVNISKNMSYRAIQSMYISIRQKNPRHKFSVEEIRLIAIAYRKHPKPYNRNHRIVNPKREPVNQFEPKPVSDKGAVSLWNEIMPFEYRARSLSELRKQAARYVKYINEMYPDGIGANERDLTRYVQAMSSSSFLGIQNPTKSKFSLDSIKRTLKSHATSEIVNKPGLTDNLEFLHTYLVDNPEIMDVDYGKLCMEAKVSSSSVPGHGSYRDYVLDHERAEIINNIVNGVDGVEFFLIAGTRIDRRGKYRLICSFHAVFRIIDFLINNGSYDLCSHDGILAKYTTEGFSNKQMGPELIKMSIRDGVHVMVCLDYKGYDTQITLMDYLRLSYLLNKHRIPKNAEFEKMFVGYSEWLMQPKPLVTRTEQSFEILMEYYHTLASGLHGTHSFENLVGISTYIQAQNLSMRFKGFGTNGDDQNAKVNKNDLDRYMKFIEKYFKISWDKSLVGHVLTVGGKLWFSENYHPMWEIGTMRSIWEKEGGKSDVVEPSKFQANYCKIVQVAIVLIRLGKSEQVVRSGINNLCALCDPMIDPHRIPITLINLNQLPTKSATRYNVPRGLKSVKNFLKSKTFNLKTLNVDNFYDMLLSMYRARKFYTLEPNKIEYHSKGFVVRIMKSFDYSTQREKDIPGNLEGLVIPDNMNGEQLLVRSILQSTMSYDGPDSADYEFSDMYSLALAVNRRNAHVGRTMHSI